MRIRLTLIALDHDGRTFPEGAVVEGVTLDKDETYGEDEIPLELAQARLAAGSAELAIDGVTVVSPQAQAAIAQISASIETARAAALAMLDAAEAGTDSDKLALAEAMRSANYDLPEDQRDRMRAFHDQLDAISAELARAAADKPPKRSRRAGGADA